MAVKPPKKPDPTERPAKPADARSGPARPRVPATTPGRLSHDANYHRAAHARRLGLDSPSGLAGPGPHDLAEMLEGAPTKGASLAELLPSARTHGHPDLPEVETRPPPFLSPLAAMKDVYLRVRGRASARTVELLEGVDLEDLLDRLKALAADETLRGRSEARLPAGLRRQLEDEPGPFLVGLADPRLTEPWRLFLDGWDIWRPEGRDDGVELFWEGEAEDRSGRPIEAMQALQCIDAEVTLETRLGPDADRLTFDGQAFYRLRRR